MTVPGLEVDLGSEVPVYRQIADGIRAAVREGRLSPGGKLPPTRDLARVLGVNRNTVIAAYELLAAEGAVRSHTGRGTYLAPADRVGIGTAGESWPTGFARSVEGPGVGGLLSAYRVATSGDGISFAGSYPAKDLMPAEEFGAAMARVLAESGSEILSYGPTAGLPALRETIAEEMRRKGSRASGDGVLVTNGSQQALDLLFRALLDPGDTVVLEEPTYTGALSVLHSLGARLVTVPTDEHGIRPDVLAAALERHRPRVVYLQPTFHNPTTAVMPESRRREVLEVASRQRCAIIEDDWAGDLRFEGSDVPTLHAMDGGRNVLYVSTFSKKLLPGLRVGWVAAPPPVFERLLVLKQIQDCGTSPVVQAALHAFLKDGGLESHLRRVRPEYRRRRDAMLDAIARHFPANVVRTRPEGGLFVWAILPEGLDTGDLLAASRDRGVLFNNGDLFHAGGGGRNTLRLTYAAVAAEQIDAGIAVLGRLVGERMPGTGRAAAERAAEAVPVL